jgi:nucleoid DNA-binding protein
MNQTELVEELADRIGAEHDITWGFVRSFLELLIERLDQGHEVKIRELGTFKWVDVPGAIVPAGGAEKYHPPGRKLKFLPAKKFKTRRSEMSDADGMDKYAVVKDDEKVKTAQEKGNQSTCPECQSNLDAAGLCPRCGSEPLEPKPK